MQLARARAPKKGSGGSHPQAVSETMLRLLCLSLPKERKHLREMQVPHGRSTKQQLELQVSHATQEEGKCKGSHSCSRTRVCAMLWLLFIVAGLVLPVCIPAAFHAGASHVLLLLLLLLPPSLQQNACGVVAGCRRSNRVPNACLTCVCSLKLHGPQYGPHYGLLLDGVWAVPTIYTYLPPT